MPINLPENAEDIIERIFDNTKLLIRYKYWDGISEKTLCSWINNFISLKERYLAAVILSSLIYRNNITNEAFGAQLFQIIIPNYLEDNNIHSIDCIQSWMSSIETSKVSHLPFRFSTIEGVDNKPGKSGSVIYRKLKKLFFSSDLGVGSHAYEKVLTDKKIKLVIIFDDILGTGQQFETFMELFKVSKYSCKILYCPYVAQKEGLQFINSNYPDVDVIPIETIDDSCGVFSPKNKLIELCDDTSIEDFKTFYENMCAEKGFKIKKIFGEGNQALTYLFNDSTPNNNIAALWYQDENWQRLVKR
jgi:hypothetical protein